MAIKRKRKKRASNMPAKRRPRTLSAKMTRPRRRKRTLQALSAGNNYMVLLTQVGTALAGGALGKVARNAMPATMNGYVKGAIVAGAGVAIASFTKMPLLGAGMAGSAGAYIASLIGTDYNIPLLAEEGDFVQLAEGNNLDNIYFDEQGYKLYRSGNSFYYENGAMSNLTPSDFTTIAKF